MTVATRMTAAEYLLLPEQPFKTELIDGEVVVSEPRMLHQDVLSELLVALRLWTRAGSDRGRATPAIDILLDDDNVYGPDLLWYAHVRDPGRTEARPQPVPDLAVEIRSPSTWRYDIGAKKARYEQYGLQELWLVDTKADEILVFRRSRPQGASFDVALELTSDDTLSSPLLPGFALVLAELW
ncbi:MAG: Uma2 family endonuclease [Solirubrobacteraceae bacterium MAG38_C4-C5]|nr:Uma2 family endonuclease [Candidatus Siliceabacter maunaloa]